MNLTCIRTVFKMQGWNFTVTSATSRDRSWRGCRFYRLPEGSEIKGQTLKKREFDQHSHSFLDQELTYFTGTSRTPQERSCMGWWFYHTSVGVRHEGLITQKTWIRRAFAQFTKCNVETSQLRQPLPGTGRREVDDSTVSPEGSEMKG